LPRFQSRKSTHLIVSDCLTGKRAVSNPEFLREGSAVTDFMKPDRVVIGSDNGNAKAKKIMDKLYAPLNAPILHTDIKTAELIKYASNSFLATSAPTGQLETHSPQDSQVVFSNEPPCPSVVPTR